MPTPRREFLGWLGASTMFAAAGAPLVLPRGTRRDERQGPGTPISDKWDMAWLDRLKGKHRAVFDSPELSEGSALFRAVLWRDQHKEVFGTDPADMNAVIVIRHAAIALAMSDAYWERFDIGKEVKIKDPKTRKWSKVNPIRANPADTPPKWADYSLERFMAQGGTALACNLAFGEVIWRFQNEHKPRLARPDAEKLAREHLIPGVTLQPSGIFAVLCAQEAGCNYILAS